MPDEFVPAMAAPPRAKDNPLTRSVAGVIGLGVLGVMLVACLATLPWTLGVVCWTPQGEDASEASMSRYNIGDTSAETLPPSWWPVSSDDDILKLNRLVQVEVAERIAEEHDTTRADAIEQTEGPVAEALRENWRDSLPEGTPTPIGYWILGTDKLGRSVFIRVLAGGGISLTIGIAAALISVFIGTIYGAIAGYAGGKVDAFMMRIVDILYGLPYILLVVLLAVASDAIISDYISQNGAQKAWSQQQLARLVDDASPASPSAIASTSLADAPALRERIDTLAREVAQEHWQSNEPTLAAIGREEVRVSCDEWPKLSAAEKRQLREAELAKRRDAWEASRDDLLAAVEFPPDTTVEDALSTLASLARPPKRLESEVRTTLDVLTLLIAIGGVSWLTLARVVRGQVLSLKNQPFIEAARAMGAPVNRVFIKHLLPNLLGPIIVYATLAVPQAILQESFLSFLGIGVKPPLPSWGNLAAEGLSELNTHGSNWWLLFFPSALLGITLLALNFVGEGLREAFDPKRAKK
ncbi:MAG: ABC transporter permease [Phycisphaerales bacterium JB037]